MQRLSFLLLFPSFLFLCSCGSGNSEPREPGSFPVGVDTATTDAFQYWHLTGTVGDLEVSMDLMREQAMLSYTGDVYYRGHYYYHHTGRPIDLHGGMNDEGQLVLVESVGVEDTTGIFTGTLGAGSLTGTWRSPGGDRQLDFRLESGAFVPLQALHFADSLLLEPDSAVSPGAFVSEAWLWPVPEDPELRDYLQQAVMEDMLGDTLSARHPTPREAFEYRRDAFFDTYREEAEYFDDNDDYRPSFDQSISMEVYYNDGRLLTLGYTAYAYTGGAHGNYGTELVTYDTADRRRLTLADVFKPGYEEALRPLLKAAARDYFELAPGEPLSGLLFENEVPPTDNFGLTGGGILFDYMPYEIGPYAAGEIQLFIPFAEVEEWLRK